MDILTHLAERKIEEAMRRGEFDHLPGRGQPLPREDLSEVPAELRLAYKILKNAGFLPEEVQLRREILALKDLLASCRAEEERQELRTRLTARTLRLDLLLERNGHRPAYRQYQEGLQQRLGD